MVMSGPFLVEDTRRVSSVHDPGSAVTQVAVRGTWDGALRGEVSRTVRACVAAAPRMLVVDLTGLADPAGDSTSIWRTAARFAGEARPPVALVLCGAAPAVRQRLVTAGDDPPVMLAGNPDEAVAALPDGPGRGGQHLTLSPWAGAGPLARTLVDAACLTAGLAHAVPPARLIVSELVANAVVHTGTDFDVWVSVRGEVLHLAVADRSRRLPRLLDAGHPGATPDVPPGTGLKVVSAAAGAWGALPCRSGKVVWAIVATGPGAAR